MSQCSAGHVISSDGTPIAWAGNGAGPALVLVHGTDGDQGRWKPVLPVLASRFAVYSLDRRGRGLSGDADRYSLQCEVDDVVAVANSVGEPVRLLGHSFGAICALEAALACKIVCRLVLYEPPINIRESDFEARADLIGRLQAMVDRGDREGVVSTFLRERVRLTSLERDAMRGEPPRGATAHTILRELRAIQDYKFNSEHLRNLAAPTLLLLGSESAPYLRTATEALHSVLPDSRITVMPGQAHIAIDAGTDLFVAEVLRFLDQSSPGNFGLEFD